MDDDLRRFFVERRRIWRNTLRAWELRTLYRREKARQGEPVRPYIKRGRENSARQYSATP